MGRATQAVALRPDHQYTRTRIVQVIAQYPGIHKSELARRVGIGWGTLSHHLDRLIRQKRVKEWNGGREVRFFDPTRDPEEARCLAFLRDEVSADLLRLLAHTPGLGAPELARELATTPSALRNRISPLVEAGLLHEAGGPRSKRYHILQRGLDLLAQHACGTATGEQERVTAGLQDSPMSVEQVVRGPNGLVPVRVPPLKT